MPQTQIPPISSGGDLLANINDRLRRINTALIGASEDTAASVASISFGTHAQRVGNPIPTAGTLFAETDRGLIYQAQLGVWRWLAGIMTGAWASLPVGLASPDVGVLFFDNVNSLHVWRWTGSVWTWGPGNDHPSGAMQEFDADPGAGWHICDGTSGLTKYAADGTRNVSFTVPDRRTFYTKAVALASYTGTGVAAVAPTGGGFTPGSTTVQSGSGASPSSGGSSIPVAANGTPPTFAVPIYYRL